MSAGTMEVARGEFGDDRNKDAEVAKLREMYEAPHIEEPELKPGPGDFAPMAVGFGRTTFRAVGLAHPDNARRNMRGPEIYLG